MVRWEALCWWEVWSPGPRALPKSCPGVSLDAQQHAAIDVK